MKVKKTCFYVFYLEINVFNITYMRKEKLSRYNQDQPKLTQATIPPG